ncbi:Kinetochore-associated protein 1 [Branchiostoma belcheri]|nr:Kinetochore-associated protein 1 [Branchiostoma belcheri]
MPWDDIEVGIGGDETANFGQRNETGPGLYQVDTLATVSNSGQVTKNPRLYAACSQLGLCLVADCQVSLFTETCDDHLITLTYGSAVDAVVCSQDSLFLLIGESSGTLHMMETNTQTLLFSESLVPDLQPVNGKAFCGLEITSSVEHDSYDLTILTSDGRLVRFCNIDLKGIAKALETKDFATAKKLKDGIQLEIVDTSSEHTEGTICLKCHNWGSDTVIITGGQGDSSICVWSREEADTTELLTGIDSALLAGSAVVKCDFKDNFLFVLTKKGVLSQWDAQSLIMLNKWPGLAVQDFLIMDASSVHSPSKNANLQSSLKIVLLTLPNKDGKCHLQVHSLPGMQLAYSLELNQVAALVCAPASQETIFVIEGAHRDDIEETSTSDGLVSTLRVRCLTESLPDTRFHRLLHKKQYQEALKFADTYELDVELVYKVKAQDILTQTDPWTQPQKDGQTTEQIFADLKDCLSHISGDSGSLSEDQTGRNGKRSGLFPNASQEKFLAVENTGVPAHVSGQEEEDWRFGGKREELQPHSAAWERNAPSALAPGTSAAWERNAPSALAPGTSVKEGDGAELQPPRPKFPPDSEELGTPTMPKLGGEKSPPPPPPSETPFPPGFDAASFLQWISSSLGLPQASSSSRQPRDVDGAVASTSRAGVVGSGESIQVLKWKSVRRREKSPFLTLTKKSRLVPSQVATFLGLVLDSRTLTIYLTEDKLDKVVSSCLSLLEQEVIGIRQLASVVGLLESFVSADTQHDLLRLDNATAVAYVNHVGGTRSPDLAALALEMWSWALERGLTLSATHVPGLTNTLADKCSRVFSGQELGSAVPAAQQETPSAVARSDACRVAKIRRQLQGRGLSAGASDLILSAWRESTSRQYQSAWAQPGKPARKCFWAAFPQDRRLCAFTYLKEYLRRTSSLRKEGGGEQKLFISFSRPHRPVGSATLARWVKSVLGTAGVDTATFSAHSTRGASTSAATAAGVSLHSIMNAADWSRESTFLKYYRRDNNQHTFGQAVLSTALKSA